MQSSQTNLAYVQPDPLVFWDFLESNFLWIYPPKNTQDKGKISIFCSYSVIFQLGVP